MKSYLIISLLSFFSAAAALANEEKVWKTDLTLANLSQSAETEVALYRVISQNKPLTHRLGLNIGGQRFDGLESDKGNAHRSQIGLALQESTLISAGLAFDFMLSLGINSGEGGRQYGFYSQRVGLSVVKDSINAGFGVSLRFNHRAPDVNGFKIKSLEMGPYLAMGRDF